MKTNTLAPASGNNTRPVPRDNSDPEQIEAALRESEERFRRVFEVSTDPILLLADGMFLDCNPATALKLGFTSEADIIGRSPWQLSPERQPDGRLSSEKAREMISLAERNGSHCFEWAHLRRDGSILPVEVMLTPISVSGQPALHVVWRDLTERKRTEEKLHVSEALLHSLVEQMPAGIFRKDAAGRYVFANSSFCQILRVTMDQVLGKTAPELAVCLSAARRAPEAIKLGTQGASHHQLIMETGRQIEVQDEYLGADGQPRFYLTVKSAVFDSAGRIVGTQGILFDITHRKQVETELAAAKSKLQSVLDGATQVSIIATDASGLITVFNRGAERMLGYTAAEMVGKQSPIVLHLESELVAKAREMAERTDQTITVDDIFLVDARQGKHEEREWTHVRKDGSQLTVALTITALRGERGELSGFVGVAKDITERKLREDQLRLFRALLDQSTDAIVVVNPATARIMDVNESACVNLGYTREEMLALRVMDIGDSISDFAAFDRNMQQLKAAGALRFESKQRRKDGSTFPVEVSVRYVARPEGDCSLAIARDITERKRAEVELAETSNLMETLLEHSPDFVYFKDRESRFLRFGQALMPRLGIANPEALKNKTDFDIFDEAHARPAYEDEQAIIRTGQPILGKIEKEVWRDGRVTWALTSKMPWRDAQGQIIGTFGISKDITTLKEAEAKLEQTHKRLLETSRLAGMAEVATSVLHNVGNVLNSVNVSSSLVADHLKHSKVSSVARVAALLREHAPNLATFLTADARGKQLPEYLGLLAEQLSGEQATLLKEVGLIRTNVEHINEIVAMQQNYARISGVTETVPVADLVEDALRMNAGTLTRHQVRVIREYDPHVPEISVDKHKVLQVLVNLIRNAKYACEESGRADKRLTIRVNNGDDRVRLAVMDNGVGIPTENLERIFNHGFTTRKGGHGFGLHSGALAAKELGGALHAHSDGPGLGATFTLELPLKPSKTALA